MIIRIEGKLIEKNPAYARNQLWPYVLTSNIDSLFKVLRELDTLIIATLLSIESAAIYTIAKRFASLIGMVADTAFEIVYPESAKLMHKNKYGELVKFSLNSSILVGLPSLFITLIFAIASEGILTITVGEKYIAASLMTTVSFRAMLSAQTA